MRNSVGAQDAGESTGARCRPFTALRPVANGPSEAAEDGRLAGDGVHQAGGVGTERSEAGDDAITLFHHTFPHTLFHHLTSTAMRRLNGQYAWA